MPNKPKGGKEKDTKPACRRSGECLADRDLEGRHRASSKAQPDPENLHPAESGEFVDIDPVYFDRPYYVYPDGLISVEALRVIGAAVAQAGVVGLGRLTLSRRERMVMVEPRGTGMALFMLRAAAEVGEPRHFSA